MKTSIIHIVGKQGSGKTTLALDIVAGLKLRGKSAIALMHNDLVRIEDPTVADLDQIREHGLRAPYAAEAVSFDVVVAESTHRPNPDSLRRGDVVIGIEVIR